MTRAGLRLPAVVVYAIALAVLGISAAVALGIGSVEVPIPRVAAVLARRFGGGDTPFSGQPVSLLEDQLVWQLRLPRVIAAAAVGAILAVCGAVLQCLTRNDLADPYLLGISSGASVGAVSVIVFGTGWLGTLAMGTGPGNLTALSLSAFVGAMLALGTVLAIAAGRTGRLDPTRTVLAGVAVAYLCSAWTSVVVIAAGDGDAARRVLTWTLGSLAGIRWDSAVLLAGVAVVTVVGFCCYGRRLDGFAFGELTAQSLGIHVTRTRWALMIGTALATSVAVALTGAIGFIGLVVPHLVRPILGDTHRLLLPACALVGGVLLLWADTAARSALPSSELPIGAITALVGVPILILLMLRRSRP
ncbi:FecCD family ABC transporter permease [Nocardioides sp. Bht2]|uniref:FecCD family ABC transporter permease n=1 Tax=Nocardioides sp. Bht2 TaxID=3392297 RepID=UPI0039B4D76C